MPSRSTSRTLSSTPGTSSMRRARWTRRAPTALSTCTPIRLSGLLAMIFSSEKISFRMVVDMKVVLINIADWYKSFWLPRQRRPSVVHPFHTPAAPARCGRFNQARDVREEEPASSIRGVVVESTDTEVEPAVLRATGQEVISARYRPIHCSSSC